MTLKKLFILNAFIIVFVFSFLLGDSALYAQEKQPVEKVEKKADKKEQKKELKKELKKEEASKEKTLHYEVTVTATRTKKDTFEIPKPVSVIDRKKIEDKAPENVTELLTELPGVDVNGVGANQSRPVVRGFRGQRILLMEDGIRMNNSRRQQDFGEIPALVDVSELDRVEVVRGPSSVLYGSDAIGGVINMITRIPQYKPGTSSIQGNISFRHNSAYSQGKVAGGINGNLGKFGFMINGNYRKAEDYVAPAGSFGEITLDHDVTVKDTGVQDHGMNVMLNYNISDQNQISFKYEYYKAQDAGFGFVEPSEYNPTDPRIQIVYPDQELQKYTVKYENRKLGFVLADHIALTGYNLSNERTLGTHIFIPFGSPRMGLQLDNENYSIVDTLGFRLEFNKGLKRHVITYGVDYFRDTTDNSDTSMETFVGFGPPMPSIDNTPQVPNASYRSIGAFIQDDIALFKRTSLILGLRYQNVNAKTEDTPGLEGEALIDSTDQTVVGAANFIYGVTDQLRFVLSVGRGFRSPNLIERFYNGATPEGSGYQAPNTELNAETSLNIDFGLKYRHKGIYLESNFFNNIVYDGIRITPLEGQFVNDIQVWRNENVDKLRMQGIEVLAKVHFNLGLSATANFTKIKSKDLEHSQDTPYVDTYSSKFNLNLRYAHRLFWMAYDLRTNGKQKDVDLGDTNPIGPIIPGFTVHSISAGITLFPNSEFPQQIGIIVGNLTNQLYAEFSNASFFRPAPKRHVVITWSTRF